MKSKYTLGFFVLAIVAILGVSLVTACPMGGKGFGMEISEEERIEMQEHKESMRTAIENKNFSSWKSLMLEKIARMQERLTEENFNNLVEKHSEMEEQKTAMQEARESGDFETMKELREENPGFFNRMKNRFF